MVEQTRSVCEDVGPITVTAFGVDIQTFTPEPDGTDEQDVIRVGTVKTLAEKYGIDVFIDAAATVRDALQDAETRREERLRFLIVGGGSQKGELKQLVRDRRLDDITIFTGQVPNEEVPRYLNSLDIYVAASRSESFGVAILEASACACPVVVSDVGGLPEVVDNERTGIVVPREDPVSTAEAILRLIRDPQLRASMGEAGRSRVQDRYSWESCVDRMETVYKNVTTQSGS
jgi:glycosyltransferase involved in cell wall biosynthesis